MSFSYDDLSRLLCFSGTDVVVMDAEGEDCEILGSMIEHCMGEVNSDAWPNTIQFETMETNSGDEEDLMLEELEQTRAPWVPRRLSWQRCRIGSQRSFRSSARAAAMGGLSLLWYVWKGWATRCAIPLAKRQKSLHLYSLS